jgi:hypothetical protein
LAIGFLLVILSAALFHNYLTLLVVATYVLAPLPNWICSRCANPDDFMESAGNAVIDFGRFCTGFMVVMGIGRSPVQQISAAQMMLTSCSTTRAIGTHVADTSAGHGHVHHWWSADLRHHHLIYAILQRRARLLKSRLGLWLTTGRDDPAAI